MIDPTHPDYNHPVTIADRFVGGLLAFIVVLLPLILLALVLLILTASAHDSPINGLRNRAGEWCCGVSDCAMLDIGAARETKGGYWINGFGTIGEGAGVLREFYSEVVPAFEAMPSPDGRFWRCKRLNGKRLCFFAPQPSM